MNSVSYNSNEIRTQRANAQPKISVVLPVYNVAKQIERCIDSLKSQSFKELEFIFVDDASTDDSLRHIEAFAAEDDRVCLILNEKNIGPGGSRNAGIAAARGEFISFVDPDDRLDPFFYEKLYKKASEEKLDIAKGHRIAEFDDGSAAAQDDLNSSIRNGLKKGKPLYYLFTRQHQSAIYRLAPIKAHGVLYGSSRRAQDTTFLLRACHKLANIGFDDSAVYFLRERSDSTMHNLKPHTLDWNFDAVREQIDYISENMKDDPYAHIFIEKKLCYIVKLFDFIASRHGAEKVEKQAAALRDLALSAPELEKIKRSSFPVYALCEYSRIIPNEPFKLPWQQHDAADCIRLLKLRLDFTDEHTECRKAALPYTVYLFRIAESAAKRAPNGKESYLQQITALKKRLPLKGRILVSRFAVSLRNLKRRLKNPRR